MKREKVVKLVTKKPAKDAELIDTLEMLLRRAKAGEFTGMAYCAINAPGVGHYEFVSTGWCGLGAESNVHTIAGGIATLQHRFLTEQVMA